MLRSLRIRFIIISFSVVAAVVVALAVGINVSNYSVMTEQADGLIKAIATFPKDRDPRFFDDNAPPAAENADDNAGNGAENAERFSPDRENRIIDRSGRFSDDTLAGARYFTVTVTSDGTTTVNTDNILKINDSTASEDLALSMVKTVSEKNATKGYVNGFRYLKTDSDGVTAYVFLDMTPKIEANRSFMLVSAILTAAGLAAVFVIIFFLSKIALAPVERAYNKQKRFITDAGHELKTPLTVISANAEILEMESGKNEWTDEIKNQVGRLNDMTHNLIMLARMDESGYAPTFADFSLSDAVNEISEPYFAVAESKKIVFERNVEKNVSCRGNEEMLRRAVFLLLDNAIKYTENSSVKLSLKKHGKGAVVTVENGCGLCEGSHDELFERFYRADSSRSRETGGSGIGLSVVASIVETHGGKINCRVSGGIIKFELTL